ncbi:MAG: hypothetical protein QW703_00515 [Candidatus Aenigmatarchaeota archaeon]
MVFARTKLVLEDNCFEEEPGVIEIKLVGPGVTKLYKKMYEMMQSIFGVPDVNIQETTSSWGKTKAGTEKFKVRWWLHKDMDVYSYLYIRFDLSGEGNEKEGNATISIKPILRTEYPQDTVWQRSIIYEMLRTLWHRIFYYRKREQYSEECRRGTTLFQQKIKEYFDSLKHGET